MSAKPTLGRHCALAVDTVADAQLAEIREADSLGREADFEGRLVEFKYSQAGAIDADRVAYVAVVEDRRGIGEREDVLGPVGAGRDVGDGRDVFDLASEVRYELKPAWLLTRPVNILDEM